jgi:hypothetical protein
VRRNQDEDGGEGCIAQLRIIRWSGQAHDVQEIMVMYHSERGPDLSGLHLRSLFGTAKNAKVLENLYATRTLLEYKITI